VLTLFALALAQERGVLPEEGKSIASHLPAIPDHVHTVLRQDEHIRHISERYANCNNFLYLGRSLNFPIALEGALKLKEISYIHAEGYPCAEMKHGPIALIDPQMPVVVVATRDDLYDKVINGIEEIRARKGQVIAIATEGDGDIQHLVDEVIYIPQVPKFLEPLLTVIPLQLLAYYIAIQRNCDVDKPRNLAKSVTVE
jgi:glucosamine--fructose-6-phosphate aminotransferase (isomerizing)